MRGPALAIVLAAFAWMVASVRADVTITFVTPPTTVRTVDRVRLVVTATADAGEWLGPIQLAPDEAQWAVVDTLVSPLERADDGSPRRTATFVIAPLRPGDFELPPVRVAWHDETNSGIASASAGELTVISVLPEGDPLDLEPPRPIEPAPEASERTLSWLWFAVPVLAVAAAGVLVLPRLRHRREFTPEPPAERCLRLLNAGEVGGALDAARVVARQHPELSPLIDRCDQIRFDPAHPGGLANADQADGLTDALASLYDAIPRAEVAP